MTGRQPALVGVAHGSKDPRAAATVGELLAVVRSRAAAAGMAGLTARTAFLANAAPSLPQVLGSLAPEHDECVVAPLLLTAAYHAKTDLPAQVAAARSPGLAVACASTLGPHPLLLAALQRRLAEVYDGPRAAASVVLAAAGSSDPAANAANAALAARWQAAGAWRRVVPAYASAAAPSPAAATADLLAAAGGPVLVATYLLAPGYFADRIRATALEAGAAAVSGVLGAAPEVADVVLHRYSAAVAAARAVPSPVNSERAMAPPRALRSSTIPAGTVRA